MESTESSFPSQQEPSALTCHANKAPTCGANDTELDPHHFPHRDMFRQTLFKSDGL
jgi:hypothetical protein